MENDICFSYTAMKTEPYLFLLECEHSTSRFMATPTTNFHLWWSQQVLQHLWKSERNILQDWCRAFNWPCSHVHCIKCNRMLSSVSWLSKHCSRSKSFPVWLNAPPLDVGKREEVRSVRDLFEDAALGLTHARSCHFQLQDVPAELRPKSDANIRKASI